MPQYRNTDKPFPFEIRFSSENSNFPDIYDGDVGLGTVSLAALVKAGYYEEVPESPRIIGIATAKFYPDQVVEVDLISGQVRPVVHHPESYGICRMTMGERCSPGASLTVSSVTGKLICA